jgi:integration host factor subunit alpha
MSTTTKADIIEATYAKLTGFTKSETAELVDAVFGVIKETLEAGETIKVSGFGKWEVREKNERIGRNPKTGEQITIAARRVISFKPSQVLKKGLNEGDG